jgi:hypothetical protein
MKYDYLNNIQELIQFQEKEDCGERILYRQVAGSRAFRTEVPDSDYDIRIVTIPEIEYFMPNRQGIVIGFDRIPFQEGDQYSMLRRAVLTIPETPEYTRKYELFYCGLSIHFRMVTTGAYYFLANTLADIDSYYYMHPVFETYISKIKAAIPSISYYYAARTLLQDIDMGILIMNNSIRRGDYTQNSNFAKVRIKRLRQQEFIYNTLIHRSVYDHNVDYGIYRSLSLEPSQILDVLNQQKEKVQSFITNFHIDNSLNSEEMTQYKRIICSMINELYEEKIFPV